VLGRRKKKDGREPETGAAPSAAGAEERLADDEIEKTRRDIMLARLESLSEADDSDESRTDVTLDAHVSNDTPPASSAAAPAAAVVPDVVPFTRCDTTIEDTLLEQIMTGIVTAAIAAHRRRKRLNQS